MGVIEYVQHTHVTGSISIYTQIDITQIEYEAEQSGSEASTFQFFKMVFFFIVEQQHHIFRYSLPIGIIIILRVTHQSIILEYPWQLLALFLVCLYLWVERHGLRWKDMRWKREQPILLQPTSSMSCNDYCSSIVSIDLLSDHDQISMIIFTRVIIPSLCLFTLFHIPISSTLRHIQTDGARKRSREKQVRGRLSYLQ